MNTTINVRSRLNFWDGFCFAWGVAAFVFGLTVLSQLLDAAWPRDFDDSDAAPMRSGLRIKTDHLTGCQYFITLTGSVTPRLSADGKQICGRKTADLSPVVTPGQVGSP